MLVRTLRFVLTLAAATALAPTLAGDAPPVAVRARVLVLHPLPAGSDAPMNIPQDGAVTMPWVSGGPPGVAMSINETLWREMLDGALAPTQPGDTFTPPRDRLPQGTVSLDYRAEFIPAAQARWLSLDFIGEGCGAYCEDFNTTRVFDLRDGRQISLSDLLTVEGFAIVGRQVDAQRRLAYRQQVRQFQAVIKSVRRSEQAGDTDAEDRLALNQDCLKRVTSEPSTPEGLLSHSFKLKSNHGIVLSIGRCSNHAMRALDDVGEITVTIPATALTSSLTPYGRAAVLHRGSGPPPVERAVRAPIRP